MAIDHRVYAACPRLAASRHRETSPDDRHYNCAAWAADDPFRWWWPIPPLGRPLVPGRIYWWPPKVRYDESLDTFLEAYSTIGYEQCDDGEYEEGYEKIAIFTDRGITKHVAKQLSPTEWTSKFGDFQDCAHEDVAAVGGGMYGEVEAYMRRPVAQIISA